MPPEIDESKLELYNQLNKLSRTKEMRGIKRRIIRKMLGIGEV